MEMENEIDVPRKQKKSKLFREEMFVQYLHLHPCLVDKSQTPPVKKKKHEALSAIEANIKTEYGYNMSRLQIKRKIENMKSRIKRKTLRKIEMRAHEKELADLINSDKRKRNVTKMPCPIQVLDNITDGKGAVVDIPQPQSDAVTTPNVVRIHCEKNSNVPNVSQLQCEVLELKKEKLSHEIEMLKAKKCNLKLEKLLLLKKLRKQDKHEFSSNLENDFSD
ncbi:uncharacterized protein LOC119668902 [Teleopsis dalmanni]|uniref:uncharacterized protein LOC119668902 n=1 Tax=Teleopsis dalmanni TaxID=139649 RepID=UPI0018CD0A80|nr:uncharacterized protein LOC119668902 [Teleopsis dalmanni]